MKLVEPWWDWGINPITGMKTETRGDGRCGSTQDERRYYNAYPTLEIKSK